MGSEEAEGGRNGCVKILIMFRTEKINLKKKDWKGYIYVKSSRVCAYASVQICTCNLLLALQPPCLLSFRADIYFKMF